MLTAELAHQIEEVLAIYTTANLIVRQRRTDIWIQDYKNKTEFRVTEEENKLNIKIARIESNQEAALDKILEVLIDFALEDDYLSILFTATQKFWEKWCKKHQFKKRNFGQYEKRLYSKI